MSDLEFRSHDLAEHYNDSLHDIRLHNQVISGAALFAGGVAGTAAGFMAAPLTGGGSLLALPGTIASIGVGISVVIAGLDGTSVDVAKVNIGLKLSNPLMGPWIAALVASGVETEKIADAVEAVELISSGKELLSSRVLREKLPAIEKLIEFPLNKILEQHLRETANCGERRDNIDSETRRENTHVESTDETNKDKNDDTIGNNRNEDGRW